MSNGFITIMTIHRKKGAALLFTSIGWFLVLSGRLTVSTLLIRIEDSLGIDHAMAGYAITGMWFSYGIMQFPSGVLSDIKGRKITILCAFISFGTAFLFLALSFYYFLFFFFLVLLGIGSGCFQTASISMLSDLYREDRGRALGIQASSGSIAGLMPIALPLLASRLHWRGIFLMWAVLSLTVAWLFYRYSRETTKLPGKVSLRERFADGLSVLNQKTTRLFFIVNLVLVFTWMGFNSFFPAYMIENKGLSSLKAGIAFSLVSFSGILLKPLIGILSDRYNKKIIIMILLFVTAAAAGVLVRTDSFPIICIVSFLLAFATSIFLVINSYLMHYWEEKGRGGKLGFYRSLTILIGSPTSALIGYTATKYGFDFPFTALAVLLSAAAVMLLIINFIKRGSINN